MRLLLSFIVFVLAQNVLSQSESISGIKKVFFNEAMHDTTRANAAIKLADDVYASNLDSALHLIQKAHTWSEEHDFKDGLSITTGYLGFISHTRGDYVKAIDFYQNSISFNRKNDFQLNLAMDLGNYGVLLDELEDPRAISCFEESISIYKDYQLSNDIAYLYSYIGQNLKKRGILDSAKIQYNLGLSYAESPNIESTLYRNLSAVAAEEGNLKKALELIDESIAISSEGKNAVETNRALLSKAGICIKMGQFEAAQQCMAELEVLALKRGDVDDNPKGLLLQKELSAQLASHFNDYETAYENMSSAYTLRDNLYNEELIDILKRKSIEFEYEQKIARDSIRIREEKEIRELKYQANLKDEQTGRYLLIGSIISLLLIVGLITRSFLKNKKNTRIIEEQNNSMGVKNKEIMDSINYAKRIQSVILPSTKEMKGAFPNSFVYNRPKNIIGGDFYWLFRKDDLIFLAVADCTGHGVPGALLSVICSEALNRCVGEFQLKDPASILNKVRELVKDHLRHSNEKLYDGMDISLISLRKDDSGQEGNELCFAGANSSILVKRSDGIEVLRGDRQPIGKYINESSFQDFRVTLKNDDMVFLSTDGYLDQFGGPDGKKIKMPPFLSFLASIDSQSISDYETDIITHFEEWKGAEEQVDDVCFVGFQVN